MSVVRSADAAYRVLRAPRCSLCFPLPSPLALPSSSAELDRVSQRVSDLLGLDTVTPCVRQITPYAWLLAFFHGERARRAATYEHGRPGAITFVPRQVAMLVLDTRHQIGYAATADKAHIADFLLALNGTLFPTRALGTPFEVYHFDLNVFPSFREGERHCSDGTLPWRHLLLKSLTWTEGGNGAPLTKKLWTDDGFEVLALRGFLWPQHPLTAGLKFFPTDVRGSFSVEFHHQSPLLRASLSPQTLPVLATLIKWSAQPRLNCKQ